MLMEKTKAEIRRERILELLDEFGSVSVSTFCATLGCSESTMRNDLAYLETLGKLYFWRGCQNGKGSLYLHT